LLEAPFAESLRVLASRRQAEEAVAAVLSVASARRGPSSSQGAAAVGVAAVGVAAYVRAVPRWAASAGSHELAEAARAALDARAQPREAAVAGSDEPEEAAAEPGAEPEAAVAAAELDAEPQPGVVAEAARDAVRRQAAAGRVAPELRPAAARPSAGLSVGRWDQPLPWLAPRRAAPFAQAMRKSRTVPRSEQWSPAAGCEGLS
jgi:hypothetical protein